MLGIKGVYDIGRIQPPTSTWKSKRAEDAVAETPIESSS